MSQRVSWRVVPVLLCGVLAGAATASPRAGAGLSLAGVIKSSLERDPGRDVAQAVQGQGEAVREQASSLFAADPAVRLRHESDAVTEGNGFRSWEGGIEMPLWQPEQRAARMAVADGLSAEAGAMDLERKLRVAGDVREGLWALALARGELDLAANALGSARELEADIERRVQAGELARTDLILARKETLAREASRLDAEAAVEQAVNRYRVLTGLEVWPSDFIETPTEDPTLSDGHPRLVAAGAGVDRARAERDRTRGERRASPRLMVGGKRERAVSGGPYDSSLAVEVSLPLGFRSQVAPEAARAERVLTEALAELARVRRQLELDLDQARLERAIADRALAIAERQLKLAEEGRRLTRRAFKLGEADLFTLLRAREQAFEASRVTERHRLERARADARLNQALGVIPE